ncbi:MAG: addiction module protein [Pseudomonadota bacterium]
MGLSLSELRQEIQALKPEEREELLRGLIEDLEGRPDADVAEAWETEIKQRIADIDAGRVEMVPGEVALKRLRSEVG